MHDQPSAIELLEAIAAFLREDVVGRLEGAPRFHAMVAANAAGIVTRELRLGRAHAEAEADRLWTLLGRPGAVPRQRDTAELLRELNDELSRRIEAGEADSGDWRRRVIEHLKLTVGEQLEIDNPKFDKNCRAES